MKLLLTMVLMTLERSISKSMQRVALVAMITVILCSVALAQESQGNEIFKRFSDDAASFFAPISGRLIKVSDTEGMIDIGSAEGVRKGMRLKVFREGEVFHHPVTGEALGKIETEIGTVEVSEIEAGRSSVRFLNGSAKLNDRVRISKGSLKMLFYQGRSVEWTVGDSLFRNFKTSERFEIVETKEDEEEVNAMLRETARIGAVFGLYIRQLKENGKDILAVSMYHPDGTMFYESSIELTKELLNELKFGFAFLKDIDTSLQSLFDVSSSAEMMVACDVDNDGTQELIMAVKGGVDILRVGVDLEPVHSRKVDRLSDVVWMQCMDIDNDREPEILLVLDIGGGTDRGRTDDEAVGITPYTDRGFYSEIMEFNEGRLESVYRTSGFMRAIDGKLYYQAYDENKGISGRVFVMEKGEGWVKDRIFQTPLGANLYDFTPVLIEGVNGNILIDDSGRINVYNDDGVRVWQSDFKTGFLKAYKIEKPASVDEEEWWFIKDRVVPFGGRYIMMKRELASEALPGIGYKDSRIIGLRISGGSVEEETILDDVSGTIIDFVIINDKIAVLTRPYMGINFKNIIKGKNPFNRRLYIYPFK